MAVLVPGKLLFLANPRTGSLAVETAVREKFGLPRYLHHHATYELISKQLMDGKPVLTPGMTVFHFVRNPWDTLVTWFEVTRPVHRGQLRPMEFLQFLTDYDTKYWKDGYLFMQGRPPTAPGLLTLRYENLNHALNNVLAGLGHSPVDIKPRNVTEKKLPWREYYSTPEILAQAGKRWDHVAKRWGYPLIKEAI